MSQGGADDPGEPRPQDTQTTRPPDGAPSDAADTFATLLLVATPFLLLLALVVLDRLLG